MLIGIIGENCSGKSTLAAAIQAKTNARIVTGRDYLRLAKSESEATALFRQQLAAAVTDGNLIYVIAEPAQLELLPAGAVKIYARADLETIRERFQARMRGNLPAPVAQMLERKHGVFDGGDYDYEYDGAHGDPAALCDRLLQERDFSR